MSDMQKQIESKLQLAFNPELLEVHNESHLHQVPKGSESHFRVLVVSEQFSGLSRLERSRRVHDLLKDELARGVHALSLRCFTPTEASAHPDVTAKFKSPPCAR